MAKKKKKLRYRRSSYNPFALATGAAVTAIGVAGALAAIESIKK